MQPQSEERIRASGKSIGREGGKEERGRRRAGYGEGIGEEGKWIQSYYCSGQKKLCNSVQNKTRLS